MQQSIFDIIYPKYKITKPIRLIEFFAGYGSQALALKYLDIEFEHWKICEWAVKSIQAYKDIHFSNDNEDYSEFISKEDLVEILYSLGISSDYNKPMTKKQIKSLNEKSLRTIYNNIFVTNNLVNIQQAKGKDLKIVDTDKYDYVLTYSFPCQDLSMAGKQQGMSDTSTRSGLLWEVERILTECYELGTMPKILLMENVPQVHGTNNVQDFNKWQLRLEELGYKNYFEDLIATDYGIPQTRNRCFMVSILGEYSYTFPKPIPLKLKLKDMLEDNVDEKYYLSKRQIEILSNKKYLSMNLNKKLEITDKGLCQTLTTMAGGNLQPMVRIKNTNVNNRKIVNVVSDELIKQNKIKENDTILTNFINRRIKENDIVQNNNISPTLTTNAVEIGVCVGTYDYAQSNTLRPTEKERTHIGNNVSGALLASGNHNGILIKNNFSTDKNLRIRKLTPKECFRLMGVRDEDFEKVKVNQSNSSLYHLAGDSIVVNVLMAIFKELIE